MNIVLSSGFYSVSLIVQWLDSICKTVKELYSVYLRVHWLNSVCPTIQWTDVRWWESKILAFGQWSVQLYVTKLVFYRQEKNCTKKGLQNCCTIIKASSVKNVKKHAHLVEKIGCDQIMLWDSFRLSGPLGAIFQTPWEVQRRVSKFHTIYMSIRSDQKLYTKQMRKTTKKYKLPVQFSKANLAWYPFATKLFKCTYFSPNLTPFTSSCLKMLSKNANTLKIYCKNLHKRCMWCLWHLECLVKWSPGCQIIGQHWFKIYSHLRWWI